MVLLLLHKGSLLWGFSLALAGSAPASTDAEEAPTAADTTPTSAPVERGSAEPEAPGDEPAEGADPENQAPSAATAPDTAPDAAPDAATAAETAPIAEPEPEPPRAAPTTGPAPTTQAPAPAVTPAPTSSGPAPRAQEGPKAIRASAPRRRGKRTPRYHRAPMDDGLWSTLIGEDVLLVLSTGYRVCGSIAGVTDETVDYEDPDVGTRTVARYMVTAVHEASWECDTDSSIPKVEWARPGAATGITIAGAGLVFGVLQDAGVISRPGSYAVLGFPTLLFGAPLVGIAGRSTARDLRVRGVPWARTTGWVAFGGAALTTVLWSIGNLGSGDNALSLPGLASTAGGLGLVGAGLLGLDALRSRKEMLEVRRRDAEPANTAARDSLRLSLTPLSMGGLVHGVGVGIGGRL